MSDLGTDSLVGRAAEMAVLGELLDQTASGAGRVVLVEGEPGIGKTRLVEAAAHSAHAKGFEVFVGAAEELERTRPFRAVVDALSIARNSSDPDRASIGEILAGNGSDRGTSAAQSTDLQFRTLDAIVGLVEQMAVRGPVLLTLEDLHWADAATLLVVRSVGRLTAQLPLVVVLTLRPSPHHPRLDRLLETLLEEGADLIHLEAISDEAVAQLLTDTLEATPGPELLEEVERAGGNPLFILELVQALLNEDEIEISQGRAEVRHGGLSPNLRLTILRTLSFLPGQTLEDLKLASTLGSAFSVHDLSCISGRSMGDLLGSLEEAERAGLLNDIDGRLAFRHELIREAIYEEMPLAVRKALHRESARLLAEAGAPADQVAAHMWLGAERGDHEAVEWLRRSAGISAATAPNVAVELLERALELLEPSDASRDGVRAELLFPMWRSGRGAEAESLARELLAHTQPPIVEAEVRRGLSRALVLRGCGAEAAELAEVATRDDRLPEEERASFLAIAAHGRALAGDLDRARAAAEVAVDAGTRLNVDYAVSLGLSTLSWVALGRGFVDEAVRLAERSAAEAARSGMATHITSNLYLGIALTNADRMDEAEEALQAGLRLAEDMGAASLFGYYHTSLGGRHFASGDWDDAVAELEAAVVAAIEVDALGALPWAHGLLANIAISRDELAEARRRLDEADRMLQRSESRIGTEWLLLARARLSEPNGEEADAITYMVAAWRATSALQWTAAGRLIGPELVRLALSQGDRGRARSVTEDAEDAAMRSNAPTAEGAAMRCRGLLAEDSEVLMGAVDVYRNGPRSVDLALACEDAGLALARAGRGSQALPLLGEALETYEAVGAIREAARVRAALRHSGAPRGRRGRRRRPTSGWGSLTATEADVVRLAVEGSTNSQIGRRLFISPRTVQTHLAHVFAKLGLSSRVELAAEAARRAT